MAKKYYSGTGIYRRRSFISHFKISSFLKDKVLERHQLAVQDHPLSRGLEGHLRDTLSHARFIRALRPSNNPARKCKTQLGVPQRWNVCVYSAFIHLPLGAYH